ncbi:MAG TPA: endonuclease/exonuclease/phosphatase family protein [Phycisphaerales bacterium]|nr:endonuclease/exonuclease/phosphatase family protein [Phycisphaerales bacterium]
MRTFMGRLAVGLSVVVLAGSSAALGQATPTKKKSDEPKRPLVFGSVQAKPRTPGTIRLAAYNAENLFDNKDDPSLSGEEDDMSSVKPEPALRGLANTIRKIDADIIGLEEIESYDALIAFRERYLKGQGYDHVVSIDVGAERGIEQSVMSRFPIVEAQVWPTLPLEGTQPALFNGKANKLAGKPLECRRSPLRVTVEVPAKKDDATSKPYRITLFVVHQKAGKGNEYWREAESVRFVQLVHEYESQHPGANVAIMGDFNDGPEAKSVRTYVDAGLTDLFASRSPGDPAMLTHASGRTIDFIFYNKALAPEIVTESAFILSTPQLDPDADWRTAPKPEGYASDHEPVVVDVKPRDE